MYIDGSLLFVGAFFIISGTGYFFIEKFHVTPIRKFQLIISYLGGLSALLLSTEIYITMQSNKRLEDNRLAYNTLENVQRNFLEPQKDLLDNFPEGFFLYASMNQDIDFTGYEPKNTNASKRKQLELYAALRIFQAIEDFVSTAVYNKVDKYVWVNGFLMWLQAPALQEYWPAVSCNFTPPVRVFIDTLIQEARLLALKRIKNGSLTPHDYDTVSKKIRIPREK